MESRVHREVYARFGERGEQTYYGNVTRRLSPTLRNAGAHVTHGADGHSQPVADGGRR